MQSKKRKTRKAINECKIRSKPSEKKLILERRQDVSATDNQVSMPIKKAGKGKTKVGRGRIQKTESKHPAGCC